MGRKKGSKSKKSKTVSVVKKAVKKPKAKYDLTINTKQDPPYLEYDTKGKDCMIYVDVPNKVGKTLRIRQIGEGKLTVRTINGIAHFNPKMKFLDMIKSANVWALVPKYK